MAFWEEWKQHLQTELDKQEVTLKVGGWVVLFAHPVYWFFWTYLIPQPYESAALRFFCASMGIPVIFRNLWPEKLKIYLPLYWQITLIFQLPIAFTYLTLMNDFSGMWLVCETMMVIVLSMFSSNFIIYLLNLIIGCTIAYLLLYLQTGHGIDWNIQHVTYAIPLPMAVLCTVIFNHAMRKAFTETEKSKLITVLAGSIAHEVRNPLAVIAQGAHRMEKLASKLVESQSDPVILSKQDAEKLMHLIQRTVSSTNRGNVIVDMILHQITHRTTDAIEFKWFSIRKTILESLDSYPYRTSEMGITKLINDENQTDFQYKGSQELMVFVFLNLMKNSFFYLGSAPESNITIQVICSTSPKTPHRVIYEDNGPGIATEKLKHLFKPFNTSKGAQGSGLGLPFCKRTMAAIGGDIGCESEEGVYTRFILTFPYVLPDPKSD